MRRIAPADENVTNDNRERDREERWKMREKEEEREMKNPALNPPLSFVSHLRPWYRRIDFTFLDCHLSRFRTDRAAYVTRYDVIGDFGRPKP